VAKASAQSIEYNSATALGEVPGTPIEGEEPLSPVSAGDTVEQGEASLAATLQPDGSKSVAAKQPEFTSTQIREMVRHGAFSSGYLSYKQFRGKTRHSMASPWPRQTESRTAVEAERKSFSRRPASAFGLELLLDKEVQTWDRSAHSMGKRCSSEGALLKFAHSTADDMARAVYENLGVDVSRTTLREMGKPAFMASLDVQGISSNPDNPKSATGQAVKKLCSPELQKRRTSGMAAVGQMTVGQPGGPRVR